MRRRVLVILTVLCTLVLVSTAALAIGLVLRMGDAYARSSLTALVLLGLAGLLGGAYTLLVTRGFKQWDEQTPDKIRPTQAIGCLVSVMAAVLLSLAAFLLFSMPAR
jgi:hypothetical protein